MIDFRQRLEQYKGRRNQVRSDLEKAEKEAEELYLQSIYVEEAMNIIQHVAQLTQKELEYHVSELVTLAMAAVFDDPYEFEVDFVQRRNRTECDLWFVRNGKRVDPMSCSGGGAQDVAAFALRVSLWTLSQQRTQNTFILDEPLTALKGDKCRRCGVEKRRHSTNPTACKSYVSNEMPQKGFLMIHEISKKVGLQIIMASHIQDQIDKADREIQVRLVDGVSHVCTNE